MKIHFWFGKQNKNVHLSTNSNFKDVFHVKLSLGNKAQPWHQSLHPGGWTSPRSPSPAVSSMAAFPSRCARFTGKDTPPFPCSTASSASSLSDVNQANFSWAEPPTEALQVTSRLDQQPRKFGIFLDCTKTSPNQSSVKITLVVQTGR